jgi:DNA-binding Lrp family transcriptional regulator
VKDTKSELDFAEEPRILKVDRRWFLGRTFAAAAVAGSLSASQVQAKRTEAKEEKTLDRFRFFVEPRAFTAQIKELYPVLEDPDPRLVATSDTYWLAIWDIDTHHQPRFKGRQRDQRNAPLVRRVRGFKKPRGKISAVSEDGAVVAAYEHLKRRVRIDWKEGRTASVSVPEDRGLAKVLGLGPDGSGLAVAMELGGVLVFDLREPEVEFLGEYVDPKLDIHRVCVLDEDCSQWNFAPCVCDVVSPDTTGGAEGAVVSQYDRVTGLVTTQTLPCGSPMPPGVICVCNCVSTPASVSSGSHTICTCNLVCTCDMVSF